MSDRLPLPLAFNQRGDVERCTLRPGKVHSAEGWIFRSAARRAQPPQARLAAVQGRVLATAQRGDAAVEGRVLAMAQRIQPVDISRAYAATPEAEPVAVDGVGKSGVARHPAQTEAVPAKAPHSAAEVQRLSMKAAEMSATPEMHATAMRLRAAADRQRNHDRGYDAHG